MQELFILGLLLTFIYININNSKNKNNTSNKFTKQSDVHIFLKHFFSRPLPNNNNYSQLTKHKEKGRIKVIVLENQAYWVSDNIIYEAEAIDGEIQRHTAKPVDIDSLSKRDLDKMLFVLDCLKDGKQNDSGSAGNTRI